MSASITIGSLALASDGKTLTGTLAGGSGSGYAPSSGITGITVSVSGLSAGFVSTAISGATLTVVLGYIANTSEVVTLTLSAASNLTDSGGNSAQGQSNVAVTNSSGVAALTTTAFDAQGTAGIVLSGVGAQPASSYIQFWSGNSFGSRLDFEFTGARLDIQLFTFTGAVSNAVITVDGITVTNPAITTSLLWYTLWTGTQGTHTISIVVTNGSGYFAMPATGTFRIGSSGSPTVAYASGFGPAFDLLGNATTFVPEIRSFTNASSNALLDLPNESFRFQAKISTLKLFVQSVGAGTTLKVALTIDGVRQASQPFTISSSTFSYVTISSSLDATAQHDYIVEIVLSSFISGIGVYVWGVMTDGGTGVVVSPSFSARGILYCAGDSLMFNEDETGDASLGFPSLVAQAAGLACANFGVGGQNTQQIAGRVGTDIASLKSLPTKILLMSGTNDYLQTRDPVTFTQANYVPLLNNLRTAAPSVPITALSIPYDDDISVNATIDTYYNGEHAAFTSVADGNSRWEDTRSWTVQGATPSDYDTGFIVHLSTQGHSHFADHLIPLFVPPSANQSPFILRPRLARQIVGGNHPVYN